MNPADVPPTVLIRSALQAFHNANVEATILYVVDKNGKRTTRADTNAGPQGMARHLAAAKIQEGAVDRAAIALHEFRLSFVGDLEALPEDVREEMNKCVLCRLSENWSQLDEVDREGHREIVKLVIAHAMMPTNASLVTV